jgi:hypothetical protein
VLICKQRCQSSSIRNGGESTYFAALTDKDCRECANAARYPVFLISDASWADSLPSRTGANGRHKKTRRDGRVSVIMMILIKQPLSSSSRGA